jgi:hypothetical protein
MSNHTERITSVIRTIRGQKVILDFDLARIYGVPTKALNQAIRRNVERFPKDFLFQLSLEEVAGLNRSQFATASETPKTMRSQIVTASKRNARFQPYAFTDHGAIMAANVLNSPAAVRMSVFVVRVPQLRDADARPARQHEGTGKTTGRAGKETYRSAGRT